jgi:hypothetical protein
VTVLATDALSATRRARDAIENSADATKQKKYAEEAARQDAFYSTLAFDVHGSLSKRESK